jgi:hypothetical protein
MQGIIIKRVKQVSILLAILLSSELIHWEFIPSGDLMRWEQKICARSLPILDFLKLWLVQLSAEALSVALRNTGCKSSVMFSIVNMYREMQ